MPSGRRNWRSESGAGAGEGVGVTLATGVPSVAVGVAEAVAVGLAVAVGVPGAAPDSRPAPGPLHRSVAGKTLDPTVQLIDNVHRIGRVSRHPEWRVELPERRTRATPLTQHGSVWTELYQPIQCVITDPNVAVSIHRD